MTYFTPGELKDAIERLENAGVGSLNTEELYMVALRERENEDGPSRRGVAAWNEYIRRMAKDARKKQRMENEL